MNSYEQMLLLLDGDEIVAGRRYALLREKLVMYFEGRRISPAEDYADEVIHRVAKKIGDGEIIQDINRYVFGVARFVMLETFQRPQMDSIDDESRAITTPAALTFVPEPDSDDEGQMQSCLKECLVALQADERQVLLDYYASGENGEDNIKHRKTLAERLGKSAGALQKQICLLRKKVSLCAHDCIGRETK